MKLHHFGGLLNLDGKTWMEGRGGEETEMETSGRKNVPLSIRTPALVTSYLSPVHRVCFCKKVMYNGILYYLVFEFGFFHATLCV